MGITRMWNDNRLFRNSFPIKFPQVNTPQGKAFTLHTNMNRYPARSEIHFHHTTFTPIPAILPFHSAGPISCTDLPCVSTATVTGISCTSNS